MYRDQFGEFACVYWGLKGQHRIGQYGFVFLMPRNRFDCIPSGSGLFITF